MFRRLVGFNHLKSIISTHVKYLTIFLAFISLFCISGTAFSQCIVSDGGDDGSANQLRDCVEVQADAVVDVQVNVLLANGEITISRDVQIIGAGAPGTGPSVDANFGSRVFSIGGGNTVLIRNLTIMDGLDNGFGGGVGIRNDDGDLTIECSTISGNMANSGSNGGGILSIGALGSLTISDSIIVSNFASGVGGGIYVDEHTAIITNTTFDNNTASDAGGGIYNDSSGIINITNSTISGNLQTLAPSPLGGGGIANENTLTIINSTITNNSAVGPVGSIASGISNFLGGVTNITGSIVADQQTGNDCGNFDGGSTITSNGSNIESGTSCGFISLGDLQNTDPLLGPLTNNGGKTDTHILLPGSLAIDNAGTCGLPDDQRGEPREANDCDTGSVEVQKALLTITKVTVPPNGLGFNFASNIPDDVCTPMLATGDFTLDDGDSISCTITEGNYNVTETIPGDNTLTISCSMEPADGVTINNTLGTLDFMTLPVDTAVDCTFTNSDTSVFSLDVILAGPGSGTVTGPAGNPNNGGINCPGDCTETYNPGTNVTLTATPAVGSEFQGWSDDCNDNGEVFVNGNKTCVATFIPEGGGTVLNPGDPLEFIQNNVPKVDEGGEGTFIVTARNATNSNLTNVDITIEDELLVIIKEGQNTRLEPSAAFLEPNIGSCLILNNSVACDIPTLADDVDVVIDFQAVDVSPGDIDILLTAQADQFGGLVSAIARVIITSSDGCTLASPGTSGGTSMLTFLLIPLLVLTRKLLRIKR